MIRFTTIAPAVLLGITLVVLSDRADATMGQKAQPQAVTAFTGR